MTRLLPTISISFAASFLVFIPQKNAGKKTDIPSASEGPSVVENIVPVKSVEEQAISAIYDSAKLKKFGLSKEAFKYAIKGYQQMVAKGIVSKKGIITICDFSQSSKRKRLYLIDIDNYSVVMNTYVAHGKRSGYEYANSFSNRSGSHQSSLGFYVTRGTYFGEHGLSLVIDGLEAGINDRAEARRIVVHGSNYIGDNFKKYGSIMGRSFGCPAVPKKYSSQLIQAIKNGSCMFIYHPNKKYIEASKYLKN